MLSRRTTLLFSALPVIVLLLLLAGIETALRLYVPSLDSPLYHRRTLAGVEWNEINRGYLERYFPATVPLLPEFKPGLVRAAKTPAIFRVLCLGESSMYGTPYQMTSTIPAIVRKQLQRLVPAREIEVINLGATAINSNVIADIAPQLPGLEPDLVLVYTGHNEFYGPDGVGASFIEKLFPSLTSLKYRLRTLRIVRLTQRLLTRALGRSTADEDRNLMRAVSHGASVRLESPDAQRVYDNFERNLRTIAGEFRRAKIPVIFSDISSNLLFPPFATDSAGGAAMTAAGAYRRGREFLSGGNADSARSYLEQARDLDLLKFRAPGRTNEIIRRVCSSEGIPCVSADSLFRACSPAGIPGQDLFREHLHPTSYGYSLIAGLFVSEAAALRIIPGIQGAGPGLIPFNTDSLDICWMDLAYADLAIMHLTGRWPFENYHARQYVFPSADDELQKIATAVYTRTMPWDEGCYRSALTLRRHGRPGEAMTTYRALIDEFPRNAYAHYLLAGLCRDEGDFPSAEREFQNAIDLDPGYPYARVDLALIQINAGKFDGAIANLKAALAAAPAAASPSVRATAYYGLSAAYANKGELGRALEVIGDSLRIDPGLESARRLQAALEKESRQSHGSAARPPAARDPLRTP